MAESYIEKSQLRLLLETGIDPESMEPIIKRKTFNNVKPEATTSQLSSVANALSGLQQHDLYKVERLDESVIND